MFRKNATAILLCAAFLCLGISQVPMRSAGEPTEIPVSAGTSVTVWELSTEYSEWTISIGTLTGGGYDGWTIGWEHYVITSDGDYLNIWCDKYYSWLPEPRDSVSSGNNIVAARLNGVPGYPDGLWASFVVDYTLGEYGSAASTANALGPFDQLGPYRDSPCTYVGDEISNLVLGFAEPGWSPELPSADAGEDIQTEVDEPVTFDGSGSSAPAGLLSLLWSFEYGGKKVNLEGTYASYAFAVEGDIEVTLAVFDVWGQVAMDTVTVSVCDWTTFIGMVERGVTQRLTWTHVSETDGTFCVMLENSGLTSVKVVVSDITPGSKTRIVVESLDLVSMGAFPTGVACTASLHLEMGHSYEITIKAVQGEIGASASVYQVWIPS
ncbi:MAG: hypothetical protein JW880_05700 [Candidatus Thermoplasmatota archaeon]|nr:hypothetical protein [Candidatus Thermoplasmatota archaeon]